MKQGFTNQSACEEQTKSVSLGELLLSFLAIESKLLQMFVVIGLCCDTYVCDRWTVISLNRV